MVQYGLKKGFHMLIIGILRYWILICGTGAVTACGIMRFAVRYLRYLRFAVFAVTRYLRYYQCCGICGNAVFVVYRKCGIAVFAVYGKCSIAVFAVFNPLLPRVRSGRTKSTLGPK